MLKFRIIILKACFNIDKRVDSRTKKTLICLYTKENYFYILFDSDKELDEWLDLMLVLQRVTKDFGPGDAIKEPYGINLSFSYIFVVITIIFISIIIICCFSEHIWHISILKKELGMNANLLGMTGLCLCDKKVTIMKYPTKSKKQKTIDIMVNNNITYQCK